MKRELCARASKVSKIPSSCIVAKMIMTFDNQCLEVVSIAIAAELFKLDKGKVTPLNFPVQLDHKGLEHQACGAVIEHLVHLTKDTTLPQTHLVNI